MSRKQSLLVIDTPKSCSECDFSQTEDWGDECCILLPYEKGINNVEKHIGIHPQCPLQDTTELLEALDKVSNSPVVAFDIEAQEVQQAYNKLHKALGSATVPTEQRTNEESE
jgi:hypothetical protein